MQANHLKKILNLKNLNNKSPKFLISDFLNKHSVCNIIKLWTRREE